MSMRQMILALTVFVAAGAAQASELYCFSTAGTDHYQVNLISESNSSNNQIQYRLSVMRTDGDSPMGDTLVNEVVNYTSGRANMLAYVGTTATLITTDRQTTLDQNSKTGAYTLIATGQVQIAGHANLENMQCVGRDTM